MHWRQCIAYNVHRFSFRSLCRQESRSVQALGRVDAAALTQQDVEHVRQTVYKVRG